MAALVNGFRLREALSYAPATGEFTWNISRGRAAVGKIAGAESVKGYLRIKLDGHLYQAHRLAWLYENGCWPDGEIDHIDGDRKNNRIANLRVATSSQNKANTSLRITNTSGFKGVRWHRQRRRWEARITVSGREISLGLFDEREAAHAAYLAAAHSYFGSFARAA